MKPSSCDELAFFAEVVSKHHGELMEIAVGIDVSDFGDECFWIYELGEGNEAVIELTDGRDHLTVETFFDERDVSADAECGTEHDVEGVWRRASRFITELNAVDFDFGEVSFFETFRRHFCDEVSQMDVAQ